jgi:hypothetical protein
MNKVLVVLGAAGVIAGAMLFGKKPKVVVAVAKPTPTVKYPGAVTVNGVFYPGGKEQIIYERVNAKYSIVSGGKQPGYIQVEGYWVDPASKKANPDPIVVVLPDNFTGNAQQNAELVEQGAAVDTPAYQQALDVAYDAAAAAVPAGGVVTWTPEGGYAPAPADYNPNTGADDWF